jgi:pimeloyl-ACP methyl ester carboxylesterase
VLPALAQHFTVYAFDWPGCAHSDPRPLPYDIPDFATALNGFLDALEISRTHLAGIGGGAMSSLEFAATRPQYVERLVLEVLPVWTRAEAKQTWFDLMQSWFDENLVPRPFDDWAEVDRMFVNLDPETRRIALERKAADFNERGREWASMLTVGQLRYDARPRFPQVQAPTLLLNGENANDHLRRHEREVQAAIPDARLEIMPGTHVTAAFDQPQLYLELLLEFLGG